MDSCIRGFHVYKDIWIREREDRNLMDPYVVVIKKGVEVIGHIPRKISAVCCLFIQKGGILTCRIMDCTLLTCCKVACRFHASWCFIQSHDVELMARIRKLVQSACTA